MPKDYVISRVDVADPKACAGAARRDFHSKPYRADRAPRLAAAEIEMALAEGA
ncbi:MAG: hypothetical protein ABR929_00250 [Roseiarcus sp.]|jgi:uncharacterized protein (DUF1330 family)